MGRGVLIGLTSAFVVIGLVLYGLYRLGSEVEDTPVVSTTSSLSPSPITSGGSESITPTPTPKTPAPPRAADIRVPFGTAIVDGVPDTNEWPGEVLARSDKLVFGSARDVIATWQLMWDDDALYLLAETRDLTPQAPDPNRPDQAYKGDSLSLELGNDTASLTTKSKVRSTDGHYLFGTTDGDVGWVVMAVNAPKAGGSTFDSGPARAGIEAVMARTEEGYRIEMKIPWWASGLKAPGLGGRYAYNLNISDAKPDGGLGAMYSSNADRSLAKQTKPGTWQILQLAP